MKYAVKSKYTLYLLRSGLDLSSKKHENITKKRRLIKKLHKLTGISYRKMATGNDLWKPLAQSTITRFMNPAIDIHAVSNLRHETLCHIAATLSQIMLNRLSDGEKQTVINPSPEMKDYLATIKILKKLLK